MKFKIHSISILPATLLLAISHASIASDLGLEERQQLGQEDSPQCLESSSRIEQGMRIVTEGDDQRTEDFVEFRRDFGLDGMDRTDVVLLEDPEDTDICRKLGEKHLESILEPHSGDPDGYANEVSFFRMADYYLVVITPAPPISPEHKIRVQTGMRSYQFTAYDSDINEVWSRDIAL